MERLSIDEVIEHCNKTCDMTEKIAKAIGHELQSIESKQFWEHYQVREWLKELKKYKDAEEQGLLLRLPYKVGDTVWYIDDDDDDYPLELLVTKIEVEENDYLRYHAREKDNCGKIGFIKDDFGKTVFLTKEEAEQALKQMGE